MKKNINKLIFCMCAVWLSANDGSAQVIKLKDHQNYQSDIIGTFQGITFKEAGFSGLYPIPNTDGKEFWTVSDRGVNVDGANANPSTCRPTYDKIYSFPTYAPKIHRIRLNAADSSVVILKTITLKRPDGTTATGLLNPTGFGSTAAEVPSTDTVTNCANFAMKTVAKDIWGIDSEGIVVDKDGNFWICEEGGPTIWKVSPAGVVLKRFTPYANLPGAESIDVQIDSVFKYRKNNRGFEGISITPKGLIYAIIQSPVLYPTKTVGEATKIHRILEINPFNNSTRMFAYLNDGIKGSSGSNQIRLRDWKIGDMAAISDSTFLVMEAALRGTSDFKLVYKININGATVVTSGLYNGKTLEALVDENGLAANNIVPVKKTLFLDLLANGWPAVLEKAEGIAILNDSTIAIGNDNDYGQFSPTENGIAVATGVLSHVITYRLQGSSKLAGFKSSLPQGITGPSTTKSPYLTPETPGVKFTSILTAGDVVNGYKMSGIPDGTGAFDNNDGTFTMLVNHEIPAAQGVVRAHGSTGAYVSKWTINKSDLSVVAGADLVKNVNLWNGLDYTTFNAGNPSPLAAFGRFCSADLPAVSAFYNSATGLGTKERIFMNGEESGPEGRAFGHISTGLNAGITYELPRLGKLSFENALAHPATGNKTVVVGLDDATPGQIYFYIGTKTDSGTEMDKAGLTNGNLYGVAVSGMATETNANFPAPNTPFTLANLGNVENTPGSVLNTTSTTAGVTSFLRPEDGAWDPKNPSNFYFVTTNGFANPSRLWKLSLNDVNNPETGGTVTVLLEGNEGHKMLDNIGMDNFGHILMQEDVGNNPHIGKTWEYTIATDQLKQVAGHDSTRFISGQPNFLTQDEEGSGIIDASEILGQGYFLLVDQAHYSIPGEVFEGGQILAMFNLGSVNKAPLLSIDSPLNGEVFNAPATITISATASDVDGSVKSVKFFNGSVLLAKDTTAPYTIIMNQVEAGNYILTAVAEDNLGKTTITSVNVIVSGCTGSGTITYQMFNNITGTQIAKLTGNSSYPNRPSSISERSMFEGPVNAGDNFGARMIGYICAPQTGNYTFYISGDDRAELWLSKNTDPENKKLIAFLPGHTLRRSYTKYPEQKSAPIHLIKGASYFIQALHKEAGSADHVSVAWTMPNLVTENPIPGNRLSPITMAMLREDADINSVESELIFEDLNVSPVPASDELNIKFYSNGATAQVSLVDGMSNEVRKTTVDTPEGFNNIQFSVKNLVPGIYFVHVISNEKKTVQKIIVSGK